MRRRVRFSTSLLFVFALTAAAVGRAQEDADAGPPPLRPEQLDALVAPIALYPDSLLAQVFMPV